MKILSGCLTAGLVKGGHTEGSRVQKDGYELCLERWEGRHKRCVDNVIKR